MKTPFRKALVLLSCAAFLLAALPSFAGETTQVSLAPVTLEKLSRVIAVTGSFFADEEVEAGFKIAGRISEITVDAGSSVKKGQILARLDETDLSLRVEQARAALSQVRARLGLPSEGDGEVVDPEKTPSVREAKAVYDEAVVNRDRVARLVEKDYMARAELDSAISRVLVAESRYHGALDDIRDRQALFAQRKTELSLAMRELAEAALLSPIDGVVKERKAVQGLFVTPSDSIVSIVKINPLRLKVQVPEREVQSIKPGQRALVFAEGDVNGRNGKIARLGPVIDQASRTLVAEIEVTNPRGELRPGGFAKADIMVGEDKKSVLVPQSSIVSFAGIERVFLAVDGKVLEKKIRTGRRVGASVEVLEGVKPTDKVIDDPRDLVQGQPVTVISPKN